MAIRPTRLQISDAKERIRENERLASSPATPKPLPRLQPPQLPAIPAPPTAPRPVFSKNRSGGVTFKGSKAKKQGDAKPAPQEALIKLEPPPNERQKDEDS